MSGYIGTQPVPQATQSREVFTATSGQTTFATVGYPVGFVDVWLNGVKLINGIDFTATNGSDVVLAVGATTGDTVEVISNSTFEVNNQTFTGDTSAVNLTVTGTFTSRGIDDNATSTAVTLDASGNVLVGKTSSDFGATKGIEMYQTATDSVLFATRSSNPAILANRLTDDGPILQLSKAGTTVGSIGVVANDRLYLATDDSGNSGLAFDGDNSRIYACTSTGGDTDATTDLGSGTQRFKNLFLSGGVYLGGTGAANKLDDYEEGTFTPSLSNSYGFTSGTISGAVGHYTKVGNLVHCVITFESFGSSEAVVAGDRFVTSGLPFTASNFNSSAMTGHIGVAHIYDAFGSGINATGISSISDSDQLWVLINYTQGGIDYTNDVFISLTYHTPS